MPVEGWVIDPVAEGEGNVPLDLMAAPFSVTGASTPAPGLDPRWAQPADADGDRLVAARYVNREIVVSLQVVPVGASRARDAQVALGALAAKVAKVNREGGTLRRTLPSGDVITFDLLTADPLDPSWDLGWSVANVLSLDLRLTAKPFARGPEQARSVHTETTLPVLVFTETDIPGDAPALGRLTITDASGSDQRWVVWGAQSRTYDPAATAALFYEAESRTPLGRAAVATLAGASGGASANAVTDPALTSDYAAVLSTRAAGGGAHLTHVGAYRVFACIYRPATNTGRMSVALDWAVGGATAFRRNSPVTTEISELEGLPTIVDLGVVDIPEAASGPQQWEGRIVAKSVKGDGALTIDWLLLVPIEEGSGELAAIQQFASPVTYTARDSFDQTAGSATGKALSLGGTWGGAGDADDFTVDATAHRLQRVATADAAATGRFLIAGTTVLSGTAVQVDFSFDRYVTSTAALQGGVVARYLDPSNWITALLDFSVLPAFSGLLPPPGNRTQLTVTRCETAGGRPSDVRTLYSAELPTVLDGTLVTSYTLKLVVVGGSWYVFAGAAGALSLVASGFDAALAGSLASGKAGLYDCNTGTVSAARYYDNFAAWAPVADVAIFGGRSAQVRHDGVIRQNAAGTLWVPANGYAGDLLQLPAAAAEGRPLRMVVKASRGIAGAGADTGIDDISARLDVTPRWLVVPS